MQASLLAQGRPAFDDEFSCSTRLDLGAGAWVDHQPGWLSGSDVLFLQLEQGVAWSSHRRPMYDRVVEVPRLTASWPGEEHSVGGADTDELVGAMAQALSARYGVVLDQIGLALYRDGRDSVAWHGDRLGRRREHALVATVSLGAPRRFLMRPKGGGASLRFRLGRGDLLVMGGTCQRTWEHSVPKRRSAEPRIAVMFRHL